jgi:hypothetical protein
VAVACTEEGVDQAMATDSDRDLDRATQECEEVVFEAALIL